MDKAITISFTLVYLVLAWFLAVLGSKEGPRVFPYFVLGYLCLAEAGLWCWHVFLRRRRYKRRPLILFGGALGMTLALTVVSSATWKPLVNREVTRFDQQAAATRVFNVHDELLLSPGGNPVGVRLKYSIRLPKDYLSHSSFWQSAGLLPERDLGVGSWADGRRTKEASDPPLVRESNGVLRYQEGVLYNFTTEFLPNFLVWNVDGTRLCLVNPPAEYANAFKQLIVKDSELRYRITIAGTRYAGATEKAYNLKEFYDSAAKEGAVQLRGSGFGGTLDACK